MQRKGTRDERVPRTGLEVPGVDKAPCPELQVWAAALPAPLPAVPGRGFAMCADGSASEIII